MELVKSQTEQGMETGQSTKLNDMQLFMIKLFDRQLTSEQQVEKKNTVRLFCEVSRRRY